MCSSLSQWKTFSPRYQSLIQVSSPFSTSLRCRLLLQVVFRTPTLTATYWYSTALCAVFQQRWTVANSKNASRLSYLGTISSTGELRIGLETVPQTSVFAGTKSGYYSVRSVRSIHLCAATVLIQICIFHSHSSIDTEGVVEIHTEWFPEPIVLRGTGAGIHSTTAALAADLAQLVAAFGSV